MEADNPVLRPCPSTISLCLLGDHLAKVGSPHPSRLLPWSRGNPAETTRKVVSNGKKSRPLIDPFFRSRLQVCQAAYRAGACSGLTVRKFKPRSSLDQMPDTDTMGWLLPSFWCSDFDGRSRGYHADFRTVSPNSPTSFTRTKCSLTALTRYGAAISMRPTAHPLSATRVVTLPFGDPHGFAGHATVGGFPNRLQAADCCEAVVHAEARHGESQAHQITG